MLVLGDVLLPTLSSAYSMPSTKPARSTPGTASASATPSATEIVQELLLRHEHRADAFLARLLRRLQSLKVSLVLAKGSFNKTIQEV